jgi:hypothetical protein
LVSQVNRYIDLNLKASYSLFSVGSALRSFALRSEVTLVVWGFTIFCGICILILTVFLIKLFTDFSYSDTWGKWGFVLSGILSITAIIMARYVNSVIVEESEGLINSFIELAPFPYIIVAVAIVNIFIFMNRLYMGNSRPSWSYKGTYSGWMCEHCGAQNSISANYCGSCKKHK